MQRRRLPTWILAMSLGWGLVDPEIASGSTRILLFADFSKAESSCRSGEIIRLVRLAANRGVTVEEFDQVSGQVEFARYGIGADPVVVFVDADGTEILRFEEQASSDLDTLRQRLDEVA
ncbi:MAG: hypothetical protein ACNA8W_08860 [Bradymonadaceae bacterium]